jgi:hypothetical protein
MLFCLFFVLITAGPLFAGSVSYTYPNLYREKFMVGALVDFAHTTDERVTYEYLISGKPHRFEFDISPFYSLSTLLPLNHWISFNLNAGYQQLKIKSEPAETENSFTSHNLLLQAGFEIGLPLYSNLEQKFLVKLSANGVATGGYGFFTGSDFKNPFILGHSWGLGFRITYKHFSVLSGLRMSYQYFRTYLTDTDSGDDNNSLMLDYISNARPFAALYYML